MDVQVQASAEALNQSECAWSDDSYDMGKFTLNILNNQWALKAVFQKAVARCILK
jgi:hypothetical protein